MNSFSLLHKRFVLTIDVSNLSIRFFLSLVSPECSPFRFKEALYGSSKRTRVASSSTLALWGRYGYSKCHLSTSTVADGRSITEVATKGQTGKGVSHVPGRTGGTESTTLLRRRRNLKLRNFPFNNFELRLTAGNGNLGQ